MLENPVVSGQGYEESYATPVGKCEECGELVVPGYSGVLFEDELFCSTFCLVEHLRGKGVIEEI